ncbi:MAG: pyridoxamine 5'-phosphate oxidase family protein [Saprospiraceae bacterium]|nr:pyridoxamine 5'-phosphate oxidase family protein [Saprospiraceae bacterium]
MDLFEIAKAELLRSNADRKHPFRLMYLSTFGEYPEVRTVVKRKVDSELKLTFFTDSRSPKVDQLREHPKVSVLFYHPKKKLQIRLYGQAQLIDEGHGDFDRYLQSVKESPSVKDYTTIQAPGQTLSEESEAGALFGDEIHFVAIEIHPARLDVLQLGRESHQRSLFMREKDNWIQQELVP